jgi:hypothetical protein
MKNIQMMRLAADEKFNKRIIVGLLATCQIVTLYTSGN